MKIQTEVFHTYADTELLSTIAQKVSKLQNFFSNISEARVILKSVNIGLTKERTAEVRVHLPNGVIFIKESSKTCEGALDKALVAIKVQLLRYKVKRLSYCFT